MAKRSKQPDYAALFTRRKDGRYMGTYTDADGKRHAVYDRDPEKLWHKLNDPKPEVVLTFRDIAEKWHDAHWDELRRGTQSCYEAPYRRAIERLGDCPADKLMPSDIRAHLERMKEQDYSVRTIKAQRSIYHLIYRDAILDDEIGKEIRFNPADSVPLPSGAKRAKKREAPEDEIIKLIRSEAMNVDFGVFCLLLISTGFRRGEALALQWKDIDFKRKRIICDKQLIFRGSASITEPKTESGYREVPILPDLYPVLRFYKPKNAEPTDYVFHGTDVTKPMYESFYHRHWKNFCKEMGFIDQDGKNTLTAHVMRHGYATMLYDANVDLYAAQKLLGHSDVQTTLAIYTHLKKEREANSLNKLEEYVKSKVN